MSVTKTLTTLAAALCGACDRQHGDGWFRVYRLIRSSACASTPSLLTIVSNDTCESTKCAAYEYVDLGGCGSVSCAEDGVQIAQHVNAIFGDVVYLMVDFYSDDECQSYMDTSVYRAIGDCLNFDESLWLAVNVYLDGLALYQEFDNSDCGEPKKNVKIPPSLMGTSVCYGGVMYATNADYSSSNA